MLWLGALLVQASTAVGQLTPRESVSPSATGSSEVANTPPPERVEVEPHARDDEIRKRLLDILDATGWFAAAEVRVDEGVVFLHGSANVPESKEWAGNLARNTEGVVAVVNKMNVASPSAWNFQPAEAELHSLTQAIVRALPLIVMAVLVLALAWLSAKGIVYTLRHILRGRIGSSLLREVVARTFGFLIFMLGLYLVLRMSGLTRLAVTVIGGTGLIGLVLGIAFRDITENFLASMLLSLQQPFREGDFVDVAGTQGYVQRLTSRTTVLMTIAGNQVQIPNSTVFRSTICNYTSNINRREDFVVGIGYEVSIPQAQQAALQVLSEHPAVLKDPEPWVLVDGLGAATVNLRIYFWIDGSTHSWLKVKSSLIRLIKRAFQDAGISLPDSAREMIFPNGVPVHLLDHRNGTGEPKRKASPADHPQQSEQISTAAERGLNNDSEEIEEQARRGWSPEQGENLLLH